MKKVYISFVNCLWVLFIILLPITSFPLFTNLLGGVNVAPLSVIFLILILLVWFLPLVIRGQGFPYQAVPLLLFILIALLACLRAFFLPMPSFKGEVVWQNEMEGILALGIGVSAYLVIALWIDREERLNTFFRIVNFSGAIALFYALVQGVFIILLREPPQIWLMIQALFTSNHTVFINRVNGLTFEPSWLAHQLNMFYLPIWLGLSIKKVSFHKFRVLRASFENILLVTGIFVLFLTFSRIGWLAFLAICGFCYLQGMDLVRRKLGVNFLHPESNSHTGRSYLFKLGFWLILLLSLLAIISLVGLALARLDPRMEKLFYFQGIAEWGFLGWASKLVFAERIVYWIAGLGVFFRYPFLGVGLGNSGYFFQQTLDSFGYLLNEVLRVLLWDSFLPNPKNLWIRILAETGILGFSTFIAWLWLGWKTALGLERHSSPVANAIGLIGQVTLIGLIIEGFSLDTFALPYYWLSFGLVVAAFRLFLKVPQKNEA